MTLRDHLVALVDGSATRGVVERVVAEQVGTTVEPGSARRTRMTWKPGGRLRVFFDVPVDGRPHPATIRWDDIDRPHDATVEVWPDDRQWPHLRQVLAPDVIEAVLSAAGCHGEEPPVLDVVRYRPGQRHVVRVRAAGGVVYVKIGAAGSGAATAARVGVLASAFEPLGIVAPAPCWWSAPLGAVAARASPGSTLAVPPGDPTAARPGVSRIGGVLAALHRSPVPAGVALPAVDAADAARVTWRASAHVRAFHPELADDFRAVLDTAVATIGTGGGAALLHGDAKLDHFLTDRGTRAVIDLDSAAVGPPASDLGRMLASLWWEAGPGGLEPLRDALLDGYGDPGLDDREIDAWTALALVRQAARRIPVLAPDLAERFAASITAARRR